MRLVRLHLQREKRREPLKAAFPDALTEEAPPLYSPGTGQSTSGGS